MTTVLLPAAWAVTLVALTAPRRPRPRLPLPVRAGRGGDPVARLGGSVLALVGRRAEDRSTARLVGWCSVAALGCAFAVPPAVVVPLVVALVVPRVRRRQAVRGVDRAAEDALPEVVDLLALTAGSGLGLVPSLAIVGTHAPDPLRGRIAAARERLEHGAPVAVALAPVASGGGAAAGLVDLLVAAERDGTPLVEPLERLATDLRAAARRRAETRARRVPVRLLFPLVGCTLPAFVLVTVVPPVLTALGSLDL